MSGGVMTLEEYVRYRASICGYLVLRDDMCCLPAGHKEDHRTRDGWTACRECGAELLWGHRPTCSRRISELVGF